MSNKSIFNDEHCIAMSKKLKKLRENKKDVYDKPRSHSKTVDEIEKKYEADYMSGKSLQYYEVTDPKHSRFYAVKSMRVENLYALSDFYGVSCDYLLGTKFYNRPTTIGELATEIGLDNKSVKILKAVAKDTNKEKLQFVINDLIHSIDTQKLWEYTGKDEVHSYIQKSFLENLEKYLYFKGEPQYINSLSEEVNERILEEYGQFNLSEDEVSNVLLVELQNILKNSRKSFEKARKKYYNKILSILKKGKSK